ncbi:MAG TPA: pepsin/retropepsin-like aspartic protease family protein, partial [Rhizomicrobium sp.]
AFSGAMGLDAQALSQPCGPLKEVASLKMTVLADGARVGVPLTINGTPVLLLVDTGAGMSSLTGPAAAQLGMRQRNSDAMHLVNADGAAIHRYYLADNFQLGRLAAKNVPFMQNVDIGEARISGAIGPDLMVHYDVEMDFSQQRLTYFSQDHCPGHVVHWSSDAVTQVPIGIAARAKDYPPPLVAGAAIDFPSDLLQTVLTRAVAPVLGTDIRTQVMLDGHVFTANIDTGLDYSTINSKAAQDYFDVPLDRHPSGASETHQDRPAQVGSGTEAVTVTGWRAQHRFHTLSFGGVTVTNPLFVLKPGPLGVHKAGAPVPPDITIGMNVLHKLHLYFAFGERRLYVSAAGQAQAETDRSP